MEKEMEKEMEMEEQPVAEETFESETEEMTFEKITGSTTEMLKAEGYITVIKRFMSKIGKLCVGEVMTEGKIAAVVKDAERYGINAILYTPFFIPAADGYFKKNPSPVKKAVIADYPFGESSFGARQSDCAEGLKSVADAVILTYPVAAERAGIAEEIKKQTNKIFKKCKKDTGVAINGNIATEEIKAAVDMFADAEIGGFYMFADEITGKDLYATVKLAAVSKKNKKLFVITDVDDAAAVYEIISAGADGVFTPYAEKIGSALADMAGISL